MELSKINRRAFFPLYLVCSAGMIASVFFDKWDQVFFPFAIIAVVSGIVEDRMYRKPKKEE